MRTYISSSTAFLEKEKFSHATPPPPPPPPKKKHQQLKSVPHAGKYSYFTSLHTKDLFYHLFNSFSLIMNNFSNATVTPYKNAEDDHSTFEKFVKGIIIYSIQHSIVLVCL